MHDALIALATALVGLGVLAVLYLLVRPLLRRLPWRVEERPRGAGVAFELRRPGQPPRPVAYVEHGPDFEARRAQGVREAQAACDALNGRRRRQPPTTSAV
jgi:hypothetical protein